MRRPAYRWRFRQLGEALDFTVLAFHLFDTVNKLGMGAMRHINGFADGVPLSILAPEMGFLVENRVLISFLSVWALVLVGVVLQWRFRSILKNSHPSEWSRLGSPSFPQRPGPTIALLRFLWHGEYKRIGDPRLARVCAWLRAVYMLFIVAMLFALVFSFRMA